MKPFDPTEFDSCLVLTTDERLARSVRSETSLIHSVLNQKSWVQSVEVLSVSAWLESVWDSLLESDQLLKPIQELALVKHVIDSVGGLPDRMISTSQVARQVTKAIDTCYRYDIKVGTEEYFFKPEYQHVSIWKKQVELTCKKKNLIMRSMVPQRLVNSYTPESYMEHDRVVLVGGWDVFDTSIRGLLTHLADHGIEIHWRSQPLSEVAVASIVRPQTQHAEYVAAACWANQVLQSYIGREAEAPRIAIALKDKFRESPRFCHVLHEHCGNPADISGARSWDMAGVSSLGDNPLMSEAFNVLMLSKYDNGAEDISRILRSPNLIGANVEHSFRARIDLAMREKLGRKVSLASLMNLVSALSAGGSSHLISVLERLTALLDQPGSLRYPSEWAEHFNEMLKVSGWLTPDSKSSEYMQVISAYKRCLMNFSSLDRQLGSINLPRAQMWLREILDTTRFQAKLPYIAPITVMGWDDVGSEQFDHIYVLGVSDSALPGDVNVNPFIPVELQEKAKVPGSTSDLVIEQAERWLESVKGTALNSVVFSCSMQDQFGSPQALSGFVSEFTVLEQDFQGSHLFQRAGNLSDYPLDEADVPLPVPAREIAQIKGGTSIIRDYVASPFAAFAKFRLGIKPMPEEVVGITPKEQGIALHDALERFWKATKDSTTFLAMTADELDLAIQSCVADTFKYTREISAERFGKSIINLESRRIESLVSEWLEKERERTQPFSVIGVEELAECDIFGLSLRLRLDRIDKIETDKGDRFLVIDYKTGASVTAAKLNASEFSEPQLPIYALHGHKSSSVISRVDGICLAQVVNGKPSFHMRSNFANSVVNKRPHSSDVATIGAWENQKGAWQTVLTDSVIGFKAGTASAYLSQIKTDEYQHLLPYFDQR